MVLKAGPQGYDRQRRKFSVSRIIYPTAALKNIVAVSGNEAWQYGQGW